MNFLVAAIVVVSLTLWLRSCDSNNDKYMGYSPIYGNGVESGCKNIAGLIEKQNKVPMENILAYFESGWYLFDWKIVSPYEELGKYPLFKWAKMIDWYCYLAFSSKFWSKTIVFWNSFNEKDENFIWDYNLLYGDFVNYVVLQAKRIDYEKSIINADAKASKSFYDVMRSENLTWSLNIWTNTVNEIWLIDLN